jgi:hypothetical protein
MAETGLDPLFTRAVADKLATLYVPRQRAEDPYLSPLFGNLMAFRDAVAGRKLELLLDDSVRYAARASNVTLDVWRLCPTSSCVSNAIRVARNVDRICAFMERRLAQFSA